MNPNSRAALAISILALAACAPGSTATGPSSPPSAAPTLPTCQLPVVIRTFERGIWSPDTTGFLSYPGGNFTPAGASGVRYDAQRKRWLPRGLPTPDGSSYLYADATNAIHRVVVDSGLDEAVLKGGWIPIGFIGDRLYVAEARLVPQGFESGGYTVGRLASTGSSGGTPELVTQHLGPWWVSSLGGWTLDRADGMMQAPDRVLHLDLTTGVIEPWLTGIPGVMFSGFDAQGHPFVFNHGDTVHVVRLTGKGDARVVFDGPSTAPWPKPPSYVDGDRVWFSGFSITDPKFDAPALLYQPEVGLRPSVGVPGAQVTVAGPCTKE